MSFNTDWDIDQYRTKFESEEHWILKRDFIRAHKDKFPEDRLICLAQVYVNIELLRCKYPDRVMEQVSILAKEVGHKYRENKKNRLQRTFVKASDAASAKVRGEKRSYPNANENREGNSEDKGSKIHLAENIQQTRVSSISPTSGDIDIRVDKYINFCKNRTTDASDVANSISPKIRAIKESSMQLNSDSRCQRKPIMPPPKTVHSLVDHSNPLTSSRCQRKPIMPPPKTVDSFVDHSNPLTSSHCQRKPIMPPPKTVDSLVDHSNPLTRIVVVLYCFNSSFTYSTILHDSVAFSKLQLVEDYNPIGTTCALRTSDGLFLGKASGLNKKEAKENASVKALESLLKVCLTVKVLKLSSSSGEISLDLLISNATTAPNKIDDSNIGSKLLKMMGWTGGALGKTGVGIIEPVQESSVIGRRGLGLDNEEGVTQHFKRKIKDMLHQYLKSSDMKDLVFSSDFSKEQRKTIHQMAFQIGRTRLRTSSYGKMPNRYLIVSRKLNNLNSLQMIMDEGGKTDKYEIIEPATLTVNDLLSFYKQ